MNIKEMSDYEMGRADYEAGLDPLPDFDQNNPHDVAYMEGYNQAKHERFWDDVSMMAKCDAREDR